MRYKITDNNIHLIDSYLIPKEKMVWELIKIRNLHPSCPVFQRSFRSLKAEWCSHNAAYFLGIKRERTKDVDLNYPQPWYVRLGYYVGGAIVYPLIK